MGVAYSAPLCPSAVLYSCYSFVIPRSRYGLSWPKPQCTCNAMVTSQTQHGTNEGVLRSNSACSMLMNDDLRLPRRGIEPRPPGSEASSLPLGHRPSLCFLFTWGPSMKYITLQGDGVTESVTVCDRGRGVEEHVMSHYLTLNISIYLFII